MRRPVLPGALAAAGVLAVLATVAVVHARHPDGVPPGEDYVAIQDVPVAPHPPAATGPGGSAGSFTSVCGRNEHGHRNADNLVVAPGLPGAAQHAHDYVGNVSTTASSTDQSLAAAGTTCSNGD